MRQRRALAALALFVSCGTATAQNLDTLLMSSARLSTIQAALPDLIDAKLSRLLGSPETLWYDETVMQRSYQDSIGASSNDVWPDLVAAPESIISGLHDRAKKRWQFPFSTTAGSDDSTNLRVANFAWFPQQNGRVPTIPIRTVSLNANRPAWRWTYPEGTVFGEVLFLADGSDLLPVEIRTRTRFAAGWGMNVQRPFPRARDLAKRIQELRPDWERTPALKSMVAFLNDANTLVPASLEGKGRLAGMFAQTGYLDVLPPFNDDGLVRQLLRLTPFRPAYGIRWKENGEKETFAASARSGLSIVPLNYKAGLIEVTDESCVRCHQHTAKLVSDFYPELYLYGEMWGMDGIFSFHPYDESKFPELRREMIDNRRINPKLEQAGLFRRSFRERLLGE